MLSFFAGRLIIVRIAMFTAMAALIIIGILSIYASDNPINGPQKIGLQDYQKQILFVSAGIVAITLVNTFSYRSLGSNSLWLYGATLIILLLPLVSKYFYELPFIPNRNGAYRWLVINVFGKDFSVQPSEFCKITYILALAWYLRYKKNCSTIVGLLGPFALSVLAMVLILLEPDLGTVLLIMPVLFVMVFVAGARPKHLIIIILTAIFISPLLWFQLQDYQRIRVSCVILQSEKVMNLAEKHPTVSKILIGNTVFDRLAWQRDDNWQLGHSKLAISSGGLFGFGFRRGPYLETDDLPERHNDFIFALIAHQFGLFGCLCVLLLYAVIIFCAVEIAENVTDPFAKLVVVGIIAMFCVMVLVNVSMTMGLMPITGLTLPFVSYGGSSLVVSMLAIGILNSVGRSRPFTVAAKPFE